MFANIAGENREKWGATNRLTMQQKRCGPKKTEGEECVLCCTIRSMYVYLFLQQNSHFAFFLPNVTRRIHDSLKHTQFLEYFLFFLFFSPMQKDFLSKKIITKRSVCGDYLLSGTPLLLARRPFESAPLNFALHRFEGSVDVGLCCSAR
jgi:hypothetical protein